MRSLHSKGSFSEVPITLLELRCNSIGFFFFIKKKEKEKKVFDTQIRPNILFLKVKNNHF